MSSLKSPLSLQNLSVHNLSSYDLSSSHERVAIVGRPNVGKSTLFNVLTRTRQAMVRDEPGVTRDFLIGRADWWGQQFDVVDTGGLTEEVSGFATEIRSSVLGALHAFDLLILVMDGSVGLVPEDRDVFRAVKESARPFVIAVNKVDRMHEADGILSDFFELGEEGLIPTSFEKQENVDQLVEWVLGRLKKSLKKDVKDESIKENGISTLGLQLSFLGQPNVGKSSLCNRLLGKKRMLVSKRAGTTVDCVKATFSVRHGKEGQERRLTLVDTAGLRRSSKRSEGVERISSHFSKEAVCESDMVLLIVDAVKGPSGQDARLVKYVMEQHKPLILVANKIDKARAHRSAYRKWFREKVAQQFHFFPDIPVVFTCALSGAGLKTLLNKVEEVRVKLETQIPTPQLNKFFYEVIRQAPAPIDGGVSVKFYYLTQIKQNPPSFIAFANRPTGVTPAYRRFLSKRIQAQWGLKGIPIRLLVMKSGGRL